MKGHTIFDHAQLGHDEETQRRARRKPRPKPRARRAIEIGSKWFSMLGMGPKFAKKR